MINDCCWMCKGHTVIIRKAALLCLSLEPRVPLRQSCDKGSAPFCCYKQVCSIFPSVKIAAFHLTGKSVSPLAITYLNLHSRQKSTPAQTHMFPARNMNKTELTSSQWYFWTVKLVYVYISFHRWTSVALKWLSPFYILLLCRSYVI